MLAIAANVRAIAVGAVAATFVIGALISAVWLLNVRTAAAGTPVQKAAYVLGAAAGGVAGLLLARLVVG